MLVRPSFSQARKQKSYEREINRILYKIIREENFPHFSISYCLSSRGGETLKVYLTFFPPKNQEELLNFMNKKYSPLVKKELAKSKKFAYIPQLVFLAANPWEKNIAEFSPKIS